MAEWAASGSLQTRIADKNRGAFIIKKVSTVIGGNMGSVCVQRKGGKAEGVINHRRLPGGRDVSAEL